MWQTILTAAGDDDLVFRQAGFDSPKNWVQHRGNAILGLSISSYSCPTGNTAVLVREVERPNWDGSLYSSVEGLKAIFLKAPTEGALCTALLGLDVVDLDQPLVICPGDSYLTSGISEIVEQFLTNGATAATVVFQSDKSKYSYARLLPNDDISEMAEKRQISTWASTGLFLFKRGRDFLESASWVLAQNMRTGNEFYMSGSLNYLVMRGDKVQGIHLASNNKYVRLATPYDLLGDIAE